MVEISRNEWIIIGVIILAVIILGSIGYTVYSKGEVGKEGIQFQTGFGLGSTGNPGSCPPDKRLCDPITCICESPPVE